MNDEMPTVEWAVRIIREHNRVNAELGYACHLLLTEMERLRVALALAVGELSTHAAYAVYSPDQLLEQFMQEARRG